jgi:1-acyl-sn-glycerol-3-phosphate acyltransferase
VRGAVLLAAAWAFLCLSLTLMSLFSLLTFRIGVTRYMHLILRFCGRTVLRIAGITLHVTGPERIEGRRMRIVAFNHTSQLDLFIFATLVPPSSTPIIKKEFYYIPFLGLALFAFKAVSIDRSNLERARLSFARAARRLRERRATVIVAPEGTRSRDGSLGPFKMGMFHLAAEVHAPIVPAIVRGAQECQPMGTIFPHPGVVEVHFLSELPTDDYTADNLHEKRDALRALFLRELGES